MNTQTPHINEMMMGNPNNMVKDRSPMWKDFKDNRFDRPFMVIIFEKIFLSLSIFYFINEY